MRITKATYKDTTVVAGLIAKLLIDFNEESGRSFNVDMDFLENATNKLIVRDNYAAFIAYNETNKPIGLITVAEASAIYNGGDYGVITELYVDKNYRSKGAGKRLLKSAFDFSKTKNWKKIEVGAPNAEEWPRTIKFYQENGFSLKGPKLRITIKTNMIENLIVFDIDDTLTKSEVQHQHAYIETMKHFGINNINQNWTDYQHMTDSFILKENYEKNFSKPFDFSFINEFEKYMKDRMLELNPVTEINGAHRMLEELKEMPNYAICCATGSFFKPALLKLYQAHIKCPEAIVVGSNQLFTREGIVQKAIDKAKEFYQVNNFKNIISIGDGIWDLRTAANLGVHFVGIGESNKNKFFRENIKYHIDDWTNFSFKEMKNKLNLN